MFTLPVKVLSISVTDNARALSFNTPRGEGLSWKQAEDTFVDQLLECRLICDPLGSDDAEGQQTMDVSTISLEVVCGSTGMRVSAQQYSGRLIFGDDCDVPALIRFINQRGTIEIMSATPREQVGG